MEEVAAVEWFEPERKKGACGRVGSVREPWWKRSCWVGSASGSADDEWDPDPRNSERCGAGSGEGFK